MVILQTEGLVEVAVEPGGQEAGGRGADAADELRGEHLATEELARGGKPDEGRRSDRAAISSITSIHTGDDDGTSADGLQHVVRRRLCGDPMDLLGSICGV